MYVLQLHTRRLLQETAVSLASAPLYTNSSNNIDNDNGNLNSFDLNTHFSPSMAIILVVLLAALFFMAFFSIYIKRCTAQSTNLHARTAPGTAPPRHPAATSPASQGVDAAFLESLPLVSYKASKKKGSANVECVVCITEFAESEPLRQLPRCKHVFHKECIDMWLFSHTTCPLCRRSVLLDGSRSFRWGGSGSLRSSTGHRWGGESQRGSTAMSIDGEGTLTDEGAHANLAEIQHDAPLPRSHSTGHSFLKKGQSGALRPGTPTYNDEDKAEPSTGCLPITPRAAFQRSRSVAATVGDAPVQSVSGWMREAGASLKRVWSVKRVSPTAEASASSSSVGPVL